MQQKTSKKLIVDYNKLRSLFRFNCPENLIIQALKLEPIEPTGDELIDDILESLVDYKEFDNWGGGRLGAGRKPKNQLENQDEKIKLKIKMDKSSCGNQDVDKDIDNNINIFTKFYVECQNFDEIPPKILKVMKKYWTAEKINRIRIDLACLPSHHTCIQELLERYPADVSKGFKKPTIDEIKAYCQERNNSVDPEKFYNYYESNGWKVGKNPMKNWKSAVITWEKSGYNTQKKPNINLDACEDNFLDDTPYWLKNKKD